MTSTAWLVLCATLAGGCQLHASNNDGGAINLAATSSQVFVARGCEGLEVLDASGVVRDLRKPAGDSSSYDDIAVADGILFVLDADDGYLSTFVIGEGRLRPQAADVEVEVGPYSGISAGGSVAVVSGGTSEMTFLSYTAGGDVERLATLSGHRGHPDVAVSPSGRGAIVSTHFEEEVDGHEFGVVSAALDPPGFADSLGLAGAGFTEGGGTPASWPVRVAFGATHILVAHGGGLSVLAADAELRLRLVASLDVAFEAVDVAVDGERAYVVGSSPSPRVVEVDLSDPEAPSVTRRFKVTGEDAAPTAVLPLGDTLFVAAGDAGVVRIAR